MSHQTVAEELQNAQAEIARLEKQIELLRESRAVAIDQEQVSRAETNKLRGELKRLRTALQNLYTNPDVP